MSFNFASSCLSFVCSPTFSYWQSARQSFFDQCVKEMHSHILSHKPEVLKKKREIQVAGDLPSCIEQNSLVFSCSSLPKKNFLSGQMKVLNQAANFLYT